MSWNACLYGVYRNCSDVCVRDVKGSNKEESQCLDNCYKRYNKAQSVYVKTLLS